MTDLLGSRGPALDPRTEQAQRAVKNFRAMQSTLSSYARALTRNPAVRVEIAPKDNGSTDGTRIFYRPPMSLGVTVQHQRALCDRRDEHLQLLCDACRQREEILTTIYHEIAHICYDTFMPVTEQDRIEITKRALDEGGSKFATAVKARVDAATGYTVSYMGIAKLISEFLPLIVNALEDSRVNGEMFKARKGTRVMFAASTWEIFDKGVEQKDAEGKIITKLWRDYPLNMQVIVGIFCKCSDYDYSTWFQPKVIADLDDPVLSEILHKMRTVRTASDVYNLAFKVLAQLRVLGYCKSEFDPEDEEADDDEDLDMGALESPDDSREESDESTGDSSEPFEDEPEEDLDEPEDESNEGADDSGSPMGSGHWDESSDSSEPMAESDDPEPSDGDEPEDEVDSDANGPDDSTDSTGSHAPVEESLGRDGEEPDEGSEPGADPSSNPEAHSEVAEGDRGSDSIDDDSTESGDSSSSDTSEDIDPDEVIESEPVTGEGGIEVIEVEDDEEPLPPMGTAEEIEPEVNKWLGHGEKPTSVLAKERRDKKDIDVAIVQGEYFEMPSRKIHGVVEHRYGETPDPGRPYFKSAWSSGTRYKRYSARNIGLAGDFVIPESILGPALMRMRAAFADNERGRDLKNLKSGKVNSKVLGKRAFTEDERLFKRRVIPGKKNYFVLIGIDVSGSTAGTNIVLAKRAALAQAELCSRMGIKFAIYAHSGNYHSFDSDSFDVDIYLIKEPDEMWTAGIQERLLNIGPDAANLDGHSLEYYRRVLDRVVATDKILMYYSDGAMPCENYVEELSILQREIKTCHKKGYVLMGVGIRTDAPARHGLLTTQVDDDADIVKVVKHLEARLLRK